MDVPVPCAITVGLRLREAARRQRAGVRCAGVMFAHHLEVTIGQCVRDLELNAHAGEPQDFVNRVEYLPLRAVIPCCKRVGGGSGWGLMGYWRPRASFRTDRGLR